MAKLNKYDQKLLDDFMARPEHVDCIAHVVNGTVYYMKEEEFARLCGKVSINDMAKGSPCGWVNLDTLRVWSLYGM